VAGLYERGFIKGGGKLPLEGKEMDERKILNIGLDIRKTNYDDMSWSELA
jgi:hypothetical protein